MKKRKFRTRHRAWYVAFAERADREPRGLRQRIQWEHDNLRSALLWSREDPGGAEALLPLVGALTWFWWLYGNLAEARGWLEEALARQNEAPRSVLPEVYWGAHLFAYRFGDYERSKSLGNEGLVIALDLGNKRSAAFLEANLGVVAMRQMACEDAAKHFEEGVRLAREAGDKWCLSLCLSQQGILARFQRDLDLAADLHTEALALVEDTGDPGIVSYTLRCLGFVALHQGDYQRAADLFGEGLCLSREGGFRWIVFECLRGLAGVLSGFGENERAARLFGAARALQEAMGQIQAPQDQEDCDRRLESTRKALGEPAFAAAWAEGRAMTLEQAIEYALQDQPN